MIHVTGLITKASTYTVAFKESKYQAYSHHQQLTSLSSKPLPAWILTLESSAWQDKVTLF